MTMTILKIMMEGSVVPGIVQRVEDGAQSQELGRGVPPLPESQPPQTGRRRSWWSFTEGYVTCCFEHRSC